MTTFISEYWITLLIIAGVITAPKLLMMWGMVHHPQFTMISWAGLLIMFALWGQGVTLELTHLRENIFWWMAACLFSLMGLTMMCVAICGRERIFLAFAISILAFANAGFIPPLSMVWMSLTWLAIGFGIAFYMALFVLDRRSLQDAVASSNRRIAHDPDEIMLPPKIPFRP